MIAVQNKGRGFRGTLNYLWFGTAEKPKKPEDVHLIGGNMAGRNPRELAAEFGAVRQMRPGLKVAVYHVSLSLHPSEHLSDETWREVAARYLHEMGFQNTPWVMIRHSDEPQEHAHLVASRIRFDGSVVPDSDDYTRAAKAVQQIERDYGLVPGARTPRQARQQAVRSVSKKAYQWSNRTGKPSPTMAIQRTILEAAKSRPTMPELAHHLAGQGIGIKLNMATTGRVTGISFVARGLTIKGSSLGKAFSWQGLQHHLGVRYYPDRDNAKLQAIQRAGTRAPFPTSLPPPLDRPGASPVSNQKRVTPNRTPRTPGTLDDTLLYLSLAAKSLRDAGVREEEEEEQKERRGPPGRGR